nr:voltage-dependent T-type calcium channel subunit alpha-1H-like isoform X2 [Lepeophtheirus salmonis]
MSAAAGIGALSISTIEHEYRRNLRKSFRKPYTDDDYMNSDIGDPPASEFAEYSFRFLNLSNPVRKFCIRILVNPWFERLTMTVILFNCVTLGMYHPCEDTDCKTRRCQILKNCDDVIYIYFTVEMFIKMIAMGVFGKGCYLSETWNRLDCFIVLAGALEYCLKVEKLNLSTLRTVRVLRPLRAINRIPSMRILVMLLLDTLPMLGNVLLLCFFVFFIFGIIGVQLWAGLLRQRCYIPDDMIKKVIGSVYILNLPSFYFHRKQVTSFYYLDPYSDKNYICSTESDSGMHKCRYLPHFIENGMECKASIDTGLYNATDCIDWNQYYTDCKPGDINPFHGAISFDNIGLAWVAIFLVISLEGWTDVMYFVQDAHSFWNWVYFVLLIVIGSFFMINLCLVVIATQFSETKRRETAKMKAERAKFQSSSTLSSFTNSETTNCYREIIKLIAHLLRKLRYRTRKFLKKVRTQRLEKKEKKYLQKQANGDLQDYSVMKNVLTHSVVHTNNDGKMDLRLEYDDVGVYLVKSNQNRINLDFDEKGTQTDEILALRSGRAFFEDQSASNGTSPCNHPTLSCQELLALSTALSATLTAQLVFSHKDMKYCSTYNLAEAIDENNKKRAIYSLNGSMTGEHELRVTPKKYNSIMEAFLFCSKGIRRFQAALERIVDHNIFQRGILFCILINTFSMGIEFHKQPELLTKIVEVSNLVFSAIFAVEMILKVSAYGIFRYISDGFNVFDGLIVILSSIEIYNGLIHGIEMDGNSGLSVLRTFRLLRILKLVRFLPNLRRQLVVMLKTMDNVAVFFALLMLFIFIFSILGMNLFGCKFCDKVGNQRKCDRKNFDSLLWATVTVFQILTQEDWNIVLFSGMQRTSHWAALYFVTLMTFGNYVLFNLLVAILVEGFSNQDEKRSSDRNSEYSKDPVGKLDDFSSQINSPIRYKNDMFHGDSLDYPDEELEIRNGMYISSGRRESSKVNKSILDALRIKVLTEIGEPRQLVMPCPNCGDNRVIMARQVRRQDIENNPIFADLFNNNNNEPNMNNIHNNQPPPDQQQPNSPPPFVPSPPLPPPANELPPSSVITENDLKPSTKNGANGRSNSIHMMLEESSNNSTSEIPRNPIYRIRYWLLMGLNKWRRFLYRRDAYTLYVFHPNHKIRLKCTEITSRGWFDFIVLLFIASNCITLAMERPNIPPWSPERKLLNVLNSIFTFIFTIEMAMKAISTGLIYGAEAYFKNGWNIMDGSLVIVSFVDTVSGLLLGKSSKIFDILRVFRLVRALRPLRVINRAPGLKLVVQTLLSSLKPIGNIVLICCTFFIIFGILGVQLFKGIFYYCEGPHANIVKNKTQCLELSDKGNRWINHKYNFDNLGHALMSLFVLSSKDGWVNIMYQGLDAVGLDQQPKENFNEWRLIYFISFLLLVGFFVLNMFVGVVVENFHRCRAEQEKEERARRAAKRAKKIEERRRRMMKAPYYIHYSHYRLSVHKVVTSKYFDLAISAVIGLNVITMAMEFYMMPVVLAYALKVCNYFFTAVFILEAGMKISALGIGRYLSDKWNQLDVVIVLLSVVGIVLEEIKSDMMPINPTIMRVMRVLRIARVLKLLKMAKGIRALLDTVMQALPQVGNLGLLFFLLFFIFAALGVEMFGRLECDDDHPCQGLGEHAHFRSFGMAFLTLFRIATGDNWNGIMKDTLREECENGDDCLRNCCVSPYFAPLFFVVFVLMAQFVLVNVVVAVLMKHLEESHKQMEDDVEVELELEKQLGLAHELF